MKKYIVTGGSGFIGYHLAKDLSERNDTEVTIIDNYLRGKPDNRFNELISKDNVKLINADLTNKEFYSQLSDFYDGIYHLAALNGTKNFYERPYVVLHTNLLSLINILEWCNKKNCGAVFFSSSSETYAGTINKYLENHNEYIPTKEDVPLTIDNVLNPRWSYGGSKIAGEILVANYCRTKNIPFKIIRYHNIYGTRMGFDHVLPEFFKRIFNKINPFPIYGGQETRAFCAVKDAVYASEAVMEHDSCNGEIVHIGNSTQEIKIIDLLKLVLDIANYHPKIDIKPAPEGCVMRRCPNTDKLKRLTGFEATFTLQDALPEMYNWYMNEFERISTKK